MERVLILLTPAFSSLRFFVLLDVYVNPLALGLGLKLFLFINYYEISFMSAYVYVFLKGKFDEDFTYFFM